MAPQVFLVRVDPRQWKFKGKEKDWEKIDEGDWVPFGPIFELGMKKGEYLEWKEDIEKIRINDVIIGYSCYDKKSIEALGRIVSDKFSHIDGKRFLVEKTTQLKSFITLDSIKGIFESDPKLRVNQPAVTLISEVGWKNIKEGILQENKEVEKDITKLESGNNDWYS